VRPWRHSCAEFESLTNIPKQVSNYEHSLWHNGDGTFVETSVLRMCVQTALQIGQN
jgi:hypothetical protein